MRVPFWLLDVSVQTQSKSKRGGQRMREGGRERRTGRK